MKMSSSIKKLIEGNQRFSKGLRSVHTLGGGLRMAELAEKGQKPFAIILTCSDSRVPIETIFDCSLGELFVIRVAGNVLSEISLAGIEYAMTYFKVPLCVVLGHTYCGAIAAAQQHFLNPEVPFPSPHLEGLIRKIAPQQGDPLFRMQESPGDQAIHVSLASIKRTIESIQEKSCLIQKNISNGSFQIIGGLYHLETSKVIFNLDLKRHLEKPTEP